MNNHSKTGLKLTMLLKFVAFPFIIGAIFCYTVVLERVENLIVNKKYVVYANFYVKRYSRRSPYYLNIEGQTKHTWDNNVTVAIDLKEKLSNMYKPSFVNFRFGVCSLLSNDHIFGTMLRQVGLRCPISTGEYKLQNLTVALDDFPNIFPFEKGRAEVQGIVTATKEVIYEGYIYFNLIRNKSKPSKPTHKIPA